MALFVVLSPLASTHGQIEASITRAFPGASFKFGDGMWAVAAKGISKDISDRMFGTVTPPGTPQFVVFAINGYYGFAQNPLWEWLAASERIGE